MGGGKEGVGWEGEKEGVEGEKEGVGVAGRGGRERKINEKEREEGKLVLLLHKHFTVS